MLVAKWSSPVGRGAICGRTWVRAAGRLGASGGRKVVFQVGRVTNCGRRRVRATARLRASGGRKVVVSKGTCSRLWS